MMKQCQKVEQQSAHFCLKMKDKVRIKYGEYLYDISVEIAEGTITKFQKLPLQEYQDDDASVLEKIKFDEIYGITKLSRNVYVILITQSEKVGAVRGSPIYKVKKTQLVEIGSTNQTEPLQKALQDSFQLLDIYYSQYDLSQRAQFSYISPNYYEHSFFCNFNYTVHYDNYPYQLLKKFIFGFAATRQVQSGQTSYKVSLISRGNFNSMGRRWLRRGINEGGYACTHFQSQLIVQISNGEKESLYSNTQMRASMPILWCQTPNFNGTAPFVISSDQQKIVKAMKEYLQKQQNQEKKMKLLCLVNKTGIQGRLGQAFQDYFKSLYRQNSELFWWDYTAQYASHQEESFNRLIQILRPDINDFGFFKISKQVDEYDYTVQQRQEGIFRVNCIDCLDRSNFIECLLSKIFLLQVMDDWQGKKGMLYFPLQKVENQQIEKCFKELWGMNAKAIATQCSGTPAMKMDFYSDGKRKMFGRLVDFSVGARRYFLGHFIDFYYQNCLDIHFKKLNNEDPTLPVYGNWKKPLGFLLSIAAVVGLSFGAYKMIQSRAQIQDKTKKEMASLGGSLLTAYLGIKLIKARSDNFVRKPILRCEYL